MRLRALTVGLVLMACGEATPERRIKDSGVFADAEPIDLGFPDAEPIDTGIPDGCPVPQTQTLVENVDLPGSLEAFFLVLSNGSCALGQVREPDLFLSFQSIMGRASASHPAESGWIVTEQSAGARSRPYQVTGLPFDTEIRLRSEHAATSRAVETKFTFGQANNTISITTYRTIF